MALDKTSGFTVFSLCFTVKHKVCCLAKQQCSATASWTISWTKYILSGEPLSTGKFTPRNTRAISCSYKATRLAAWEPLVIWEFLLKHGRVPGCSLPATPAVRPSGCSAWTEAVDVAPGSPVVMASRCAASNALRTSPEQALQFLACSHTWQREDTRSWFCIRCIFSPPWGWQCRGCWDNKTVTVGVELGRLGALRQPSTTQWTSSLQGPWEKQLDSVHTSVVLKARRDQIVWFHPSYITVYYIPLSYLFTEWSFSD